MQTLGDEGAIRVIELCGEAVDFEEWPYAFDLFCGVRSLFGLAELGIGSS